jgi:putative restriction endonuclease
MLGPILTKHYPNPIIGGSMWHGFSLADIFRASHISPWAEDEKDRLNSENGLCLSATYDAAFDREGQTMSLPVKFLPSQSLLEKHRELLAG